MEYKFCSCICVLLRIAPSVTYTRLLIIWIADVIRSKGAFLRLLVRRVDMYKALWFQWCPVLWNGRWKYIAQDGFTIPGTAKPTFCIIVICHRLFWSIIPTMGYKGHKYLRRNFCWIAQLKARFPSSCSGVVAINLGVTRTLWSHTTMTLNTSCKLDYKVRKYLCYIWADKLRQGLANCPESYLIGISAGGSKGRLQVCALSKFPRPGDMIE